MLTRLVKLASTGFVLLILLSNLLPLLVGGRATAALVALYGGYWLFGGTLGGLARRLCDGVLFGGYFLPSDLARRLQLPDWLAFWRVSPFSASQVPPSRVRMVYLEGPPGAGKTWSLSRTDWKTLFGARAVKTAEEVIPDGVLADFYNPDKDCNYVFEHYMAAVRVADERVCRGDDSALHVRDRTLIGSVAFHLANRILGYLSEREFAELQSLKLLESTLARVFPSRVPFGPAQPEIVVVYYATPFEECMSNVVARDKVDARMPPAYLKMVTFAYAYLVTWLAEVAPPHIGFLLADHDGLYTQPIDYAQQRVAVREAARANIDASLYSDQWERFTAARPGVLDRVLTKQLDGANETASRTRIVNVEAALRDALAEARE